MTRDQARHILAAWNPDWPASGEPDVTEALALAERDAELGAWLRQQSAFHRGVRASLRTIQPPADLAARLRAARPTVRPRFGPTLTLGWRSGLALAAAAAVFFLVGYRLYFEEFPGQADFGTFRSRMVRTVLREYRMDVVTNDLPTIRKFLADHAAPADFVLPPRLAALPPTGGGLLSWQGQRVSMVCLNGGEKLGTLFLFVVPSQRVASGRPEGSPQLAEVNWLGTVAWTNDGTTFVLAAASTPESLRPFL